MRAPDFWTGNDVAARLTAAALSPIGAIYGATVALKAARAKPYRSPAKVICVGNLTAGGSGKTPVARAVAQLLRARGFRVFVLSRGYGGRLHGPVLADPARHSANEVGDEPLMLAATAPVVVSHNRAAGAQLAETHAADIIVMDDGHQNFSLAKDLSLVVVDSTEGFGNKRVLPAGPLREPVAQGLARADAVVMMGDKAMALPGFTGPVLRARLVPEDEREFVGKRAVAFAGIGRPAKFFDSLKRTGADLLEAHVFPDHHVYRAGELQKLKRRAAELDAVLVTTEKDFSRLRREQRNGLSLLPVGVRFEEPMRLNQMLDAVAPDAGAAAFS